MTTADQPTTFMLPPRVGLAFNLVTMLKEIPTEYEAKRPREMSQHELGCYQSCLDTIRMYVNGEMQYEDTIEPTPATPTDPTVPAPSLNLPAPLRPFTNSQVGKPSVTPRNF